MCLIEAYPNYNKQFDQFCCGIVFSSYMNRFDQVLLSILLAICEVNTCCWSSFRLKTLQRVAFRIGLILSIWKDGEKIVGEKWNASLLIQVSLSHGKDFLQLKVSLLLTLFLCFLSAGVLYLQYGDETKQIRMPNEITSIDTIRALFVSAFPQQLTMKMLESPSVAVYVKDDMRNMYYELTDVR